MIPHGARAPKIEVVVMGQIDRRRTIRQARHLADQLRPLEPVSHPEIDVSRKPILAIRAQIAQVHRFAGTVALHFPESVREAAVDMVLLLRPVIAGEMIGFALKFEFRIGGPVRHSPHDCAMPPRMLHVGADIGKAQHHRKAAARPVDPPVPGDAAVV